jgi:replicative DNA helicase Mcm
MNEQDRSTMHEAMEQQSVTISKANIQATLRAETTVLAAGNPKLGRFDPYTPIPQQIDISPALLSRFDVIFVIKDIPNKTQDEAIATHILEEHKQEVIRDIVDPIILKKYIAYAKQRIKPKLTDEAIEEIKEFYVRLRSQPSREDAGVKPIPITARQLEGIVRLSEAHAKIRLSTEVRRDDAKIAIELVRLSLMQVGYDEETKTFDVDRITTGVTASKRGKVILVKEVISQLESRLGKLIPEEELVKAVEGKMTTAELEEALNLLSKGGDIFKPRKGFIQKI